MSDREEDLTLIEFLRQHRGISPPSAPDLEDRIMEAVAVCPRQSPQRRYLWLVPSAIAIGSVLTWAGSQLYAPLTAPLETAEVEQFWTENWEAVAEEPSIQPTDITLNTLMAEEFYLAQPTASDRTLSAELTTDRR